MAEDDRLYIDSTKHDAEDFPGIMRDQSIEVNGTTYGIYKGRERPETESGYPRFFLRRGETDLGFMSVDSIRGELAITFIKALDSDRNKRYNRERIPIGTLLVKLLEQEVRYRGGTVLRAHAVQEYAEEFWRKMGFEPEHGDDYWEKNLAPQADQTLYLDIIYPTDERHGTYPPLRQPHTLTSKGVSYEIQPGIETTDRIYLDQLVLRRGSTDLGYAQIRVDGDELHIHDILVYDADRNRSQNAVSGRAPVGSLLVGLMEQTARSMGYAKIVALTVQPEAIEFWTKLGFTKRPNVSMEVYEKRVSQSAGARKSRSRIKHARSKGSHARRRTRAHRRRQLGTRRRHWP